MAQFHIEPTAFAQTPRGRLMPASWPLFAVLGSAFVYTIAALCTKRALVWRGNGLAGEFCRQHGDGVALSAFLGGR
jgi:hypothetical protein